MSRQAVPGLCTGLVVHAQGLKWLWHRDSSRGTECDTGTRSLEGKAGFTVRPISKCTSPLLLSPLDPEVATPQHSSCAPLLKKDTGRHTRG